MFRSLLLLAFAFMLADNAFAQKLIIQQDLKGSWQTHTDEGYQSVTPAEVRNTIHFKVNLNGKRDQHLLIESSDRYFIFFNGKLAAERVGRSLFRIDSLASIYPTTHISATIHQSGINARDLKTEIVSQDAKPAMSLDRPDTYFRDFAILAGLVIMLLFVVLIKLNPKLASDYLSVGQIFSTREIDDAQSSARLTNSANFQFYICCSLLIGYYLLIVFRYLPATYALPLYFKAESFWGALWQWLKLSTVVLTVFLIKILLIFSLTRLYDMRGLTRVHFFNWMRLLLIVISGCSVVLFMYFISRGSQPQWYTVFLSMIIATLTAWIFIVFLKLSSKSEHSMFHLFSYICATELIPLLITFEVLFH